MGGASEGVGSARTSKRSGGDGGPSWKGEDERDVEGSVGMGMQRPGRWWMGSGCILRWTGNRTMTGCGV